MTLNTADKYWSIMEHPKLNFEYKSPEIEIEPHMICKSSGKIEKYPELNDTMQLWIEVRIPEKSEAEEDGSLPGSNAGYIMMHDYELDCGGFTYEEAIDNLYKLVIERYGVPEHKEDEIIIKSRRKIKRYVPVEFNVHYNLEWIGLSDSIESSSRESIEGLKHEIESSKKTIEALENYIKLHEHDETKKDLIEQFKIDINDEKYDQWVRKKSIDIGLDLDL